MTQVYSHQTMNGGGQQLTGKTNVSEEIMYYGRECKECLQVTLRLLWRALKSVDRSLFPSPVADCLSPPTTYLQTLCTTSNVTEDPAILPPIPLCQSPIPSNALYLEPPVATPAWDRPGTQVSYSYSHSSLLLQMLCSQMDLADMYRTFHSKAKDYNFFSTLSPKLTTPLDTKQVLIDSRKLKYSASCLITTD